MRHPGALQRGAGRVADLISSPLAPLRPASASRPRLCFLPPRSHSYLIVGWLAFVSTCVTFALVSIAARKTHKYGVDTAGPLATPAHDAHDAHAASHSTVDMSDKAHFEHVHSVEEKEVQHRAV